MKLISILILVMLCASCGEKYDVSAVDRDACSEYDGTSSDPCRISIYRLISSPDQYDGKHIVVSGFLTRGLSDVLFVDRDSSENSILKNGLIVSTNNAQLNATLYKNNNRYVTLVGNFNSSKRDRSEFSENGYGAFFGMLELSKVGDGIATSIPYACWNPGRDRANDPTTVRSVLGENVCREEPPRKE